MIEATTSDSTLQEQRRQRKKQNERKKQLAALALPPQVKSKVDQTAQRKGRDTSEAHSLFGDVFDFFDEDESPLSALPSTMPTGSIVTEKEEEADLVGDLFGFEDDEDSLFGTTKAKEVKSTASSINSSVSSTTTTTSSSGGGAEDTTTNWDSIRSSLFDDPWDDDGETRLFGASSTLTYGTSLAAATTATSAVVSTPLASADGSSKEDLVKQIQQLKAQLAEKERELLVKDDKISILEEDTWCRICMDKKIETVVPICKLVYALCC